MGELREAVNNNTNNKSIAEADALYAEVQELASETQAQYDDLKDALREGRISGNDYRESRFDAEEAAQGAADILVDA